MLGPPQLWQYLWTRYVPLPPGLAWSWWKAIVRTRWTTSVRWREAFLHLSRQQATLTANVLEDFLGALITLPTLTALIEDLMHEGALARRDGKAIEECLFTQADADGQWTKERRV